MPKLYSAKLVIKALERLGFKFISQKGSHIKFKRTISGNTFIVIVPNHKEIAMGTLSSILRQAGITKEELESKI